MPASDLYESAKSIKRKPLQQTLANDLGSRRHIDIFSLDVEGAELQVLKTIDFKKQPLCVIFYEADEHNKK